MDKKLIIIGTGFTGFSLKLLLGDKATVYGTNGFTAYKNNSFKFNKIMGVKAYSNTTLLNNFNKIRLHDRLIHGGNASIWGGFFNLTNSNVKAIKLLKENGIKLVPLSWKDTGSNSTIKSLCQLQNINNEIFNPGKKITNEKNFFLKSFIVNENGSIYINLFDYGVNKTTTLNADKLFLAVGVVQLIDILYRSKYLYDLDVIELEEYSTKYKFVINLNSKIDISKLSKIRFKFFRALLHYLGIQKYHKIFSFMDNFIPFYIEQIFLYDKKYCKFIINNGVLSEVSIDNGNTFGNSIHYCNMKVNGVRISEFLKKISPNISGFGMAFVEQKNPGPISNDILNHIIMELKSEK